MESKNDASFESIPLRTPTKSDNGETTVGFSKGLGGASRTVIESNDNGPRAEDDSPELDISIPGVSKVFDRKYNKCWKVIWIAALLAALCGCIVMTVNLLILYCERTVSVDSKVYKNHTIHFPAITLCPRLLSANFHQSLQAVVNERCETIEQCPKLKEMWESYSFNDLNYSLEYFWNDYIIPKEAVKTLTPCQNLFDPFTEQEKYENCLLTNIAEFPMKTSYQTTFWGTCLVLEPVNPEMQYQGSNTYIQVLINDTMIKSLHAHEDVLNRIRYSDILFFVHNLAVVDRHESVFFADKLPRNYLTELRVQAHKYNNLNTAENPCDDELSIVECMNHCYDKHFDRYLSCSLPFMNSKKPSCTNVKDAVESFLTAESIYGSSQRYKHECSCKRACKTTTYTISTDVMYGVGSNLTIFYLYYPDNLFHVWTERYAYGASELISDLESNWNFYLGICALTAVQILEILYQRYTRYKKQADTTKI